MGSYKIFNFKKAYRWGNKELMKKKQNKQDDRFKPNDMKDVEFLFHQFFFLLSTTLKIWSIAFSLLYCILYCILVLIVFSKKFVILWLPVYDIPFILWLLKKYTLYHCFQEICLWCTSV